MMNLRLKHVALGASALVPWATAVTPAQAQFGSIGITNANIGKVAMPAGSGSTFTVSPSGGVVTQTGTAVFVGGAPVTRGKISVSCSGSTACNTTNVRIILSSVSNDPPVTAANAFTVAMGTASAVGALPAAASPYTFTMGPIGNNASKDFWVGMKLVVPGASTASGPGFAMWQIVASTTSGVSPVTNSTAQTLITTLKPMSVSKVTDLQFGTITRPTSASGTVTMSPAGVLTLPGNSATVGAHTAAAFSITGEPSTVFSFSLASSFLMSGTSGTLTAALIPSAVYTAGVTALDTSGSFSLGVGASFALGTATTLGKYTGSFTVMAIYN